MGFGMLAWDPYARLTMDNSTVTRLLIDYVDISGPGSLYHPMLVESTPWWLFSPGDYNALGCPDVGFSGTTMYWNGSGYNGRLFYGIG